MKKQKGFIVPLLIAIIAVLVISAGAYVYSQKNQRQVINSDTRAVQDDNSSATSTTDTNGTVENPPQENLSIDWRTYVAGETSFVRPANWQVRDDTYSRDGVSYPLFHIISPDRTNLPGYEGKKVHYLIQISIDPKTKKVQAEADFQQKDVMNGQSPWNTNISQQTKLTTSEYTVGKHIIDSVVYVSSKNDVTYSVSGNTLSVLNKGKVTQTLTLSEEGLGALNILPSNNVSPFIVDRDLNFDGHNDVGVLVGTGYGGVNYFYDFYILNPSTNILEKNQVLTEFVLTSISPSKKQLISTYKSGPGYITDTYQWNGSTFVKISTN